MPNCEEVSPYVPVPTTLSGGTGWRRFKLDKAEEETRRRSSSKLFNRSHHVASDTRVVTLEEGLELVEDNRYLSRLRVGQIASG